MAATKPAFNPPGKKGDIIFSVLVKLAALIAAINGAHAGDTVSYTAPNGREISVTIKDAKPLV